VIQVVTIRQWRWFERNLFTLGVDAVGGQVYTGFKRRIAAEKIIGSAVFLKNDDDVFEGDRLSECCACEEKERTENLAEAGYWNSPLNRSALKSF
jgi:hypothetical protein